MKSNILLNYYVLREISKLEEQPRICVIYNSDEEISSKYSQKLIMDYAKKAKFAIVLEGSRLDGSLVNKRKGVLRYSFAIEGRAAHAGVNHSEGLSAIDELAVIIKKLHKLTDYEKGTTVNVGVVRGGSKANVVAEYAFGEVDIRLENMIDYENFDNEIENIKIDSESRGYVTKFEKIGMRPPIILSSEAIKLFSEIELIGKEIDMDIKWTSTGVGSDANFSSYVGTPTVDGFGPRSANPHNENEYIEIDSIDPMFNLLYRVIKEAKNIELK